MDIRWQQRLSHYQKALGRLVSAVELAQVRALSDLEEQGLIQAFEFTHELSWKLIKDYFADQGNTDITGSRDATREAYRMGLIQDGEGWMGMIKSRNESSHTYNEETARQIAKEVKERYVVLFQELNAVMTERVR